MTRIRPTVRYIPRSGAGSRAGSTTFPTSPFWFRVPASFHAAWTPFQGPWGPRGFPFRTFAAESLARQSTQGVLCFVIVGAGSPPFSLAIFPLLYLFHIRSSGFTCNLGGGPAGVDKIFFLFDTFTVLSRFTGIPTLLLALGARLGGHLSSALLGSNQGLLCSIFLTASGPTLSLLLRGFIELLNGFSAPVLKCLEFIFINSHYHKTRDKEILRGEKWPWTFLESISQGAIYLLVMPIQIRICLPGIETSTV